MSIDLLKDVKDRQEKRYVIVGLTLRPHTGGETLSVPYENFVEAYDEYVDPKDLEIQRLNRIIEELKNGKDNSTRKGRIMLSNEQWEEVKDLIRKGVRNIDIAAEYGISDSAISKRRTEMRNAGEDV